MTDDNPANPDRPELRPEVILERATVKAYLALIERTWRGGGVHAVAAGELLAELMDPACLVEPRLRRIELDAQTPLEHYLHTMLHVMRLASIVLVDGKVLRLPEGDT